MPNQPAGNRLLNALPEFEFAAMRPDLHDVTIDLRQRLYVRGESIEKIYFPIDCVLSVVTLMQNGAAIEISTVGHEGLSGSQLAFHADRPESEMFCQVAGTAKCMRRNDFLGHFERLAVFRRLVFKYTESLFNFMGQSIACSRLHGVNERCARWLLVTQDRTGRDEFDLTQEFLATMLGSTRSAVTLAVGSLHEAGLVNHHRGHLKIRNREKLEAASCECYEASRRSMERSMNFDAPRLKAT
ncbi:MAG: Crp/Fnr family transcriptional regulator [Candidatus Baltobacteraceae bacterium]